MANTILQVKKSGVTGNVPSSLEFGELALNYADGKLYYKSANNTIAYIQTDTITNSFATINANSSLILATSPTDTLSIAAGNNITISACTTTKTITINSQDADVDQFARETANSATNLAQDAYNFANTISGGAAIDNVARITAQTALSIAQASYNQANVTIGVDATQNAAISIIQGVNSWQNTQIQYVNEFAQAAFNKANTDAPILISDNNTSNNVVYVNFTANTSGNLNVIQTSSANLTFTPSTGTLNVFGLNVSPNTNIISKALSVTGPTVIDSLPTITYRSAFYQVQIESGNTSFQALNLNILHTNNSARIVVFGELFGTSIPTGSLGFVTEPVVSIFDSGFVSDPVATVYDYNVDDFSLGTFSASVSGGNLNLLYTPNELSTQISFIRTAITRNFS